MGTLLAVCRVHQLLSDDGRVGVTAIDKRPVDGEVRVRTLNLYGDVQADRRDHGGPDKALYAYAEESAALWAAQLGRPVVPGLFGENLRTRGVDVDGAEIGERWCIGTGERAVEVEVTQPRTPCATFGRRLGEDGWVRRFTAGGMPGAYLRVLRVLRQGTIAAGDPVQVVHRPGHGVRVRDVLADRGGALALLAAHAAGVPARAGGPLSAPAAPARP